MIVDRKNRIFAKDCMSIILNNFKLLVEASYVTMPVTFRTSARTKMREKAQKRKYCQFEAIFHV